MSDIEEALRATIERVADLEARLERTHRFGAIISQDDIDTSDPTQPRARIHLADDDDGKPVKSPWLRYATWAGDRNQHTPPAPGQQFLMIASDGDHEAGLLTPLGHSNAIPSPETDPHTHVDEFGQTKRTLKTDSLTHTVGGTQVHQDTSNHKVTAPGQIVHAAGDPAAANSTGAGSLVNFPHELNRIVQGVVGRLAQHDHHIAALHDTVSTLNTLAIPFVPPLTQLMPKLNNQPDGLKMCADDVLPKLTTYVSSAMTQALDKLTSSPLAAVAEIAQGGIAGQMGGLLGQVGSLMSGAGLSGAADAAAQMFLGQAQAGLAAAAAGGNADLDSALSSLTSLAAGTPIAGLLGDAVGQLRAVMGSTAGLMGGLSGLLDGQVNATKGTIKSMLLGGYGS